MLGIRKLIKTHRRLRVQKKNYYIRPKVRFHVDKEDYPFFILPTVLIQPWFRRYPGSSVIDIYWMHFIIAIGLWMRKEDK